MKKGLVIGIIAVVVLLVMVFVGMRLNSPSDDLSNQVPDNSQVQDNSTTIGDNNVGSSVKTYPAEISGFAFSPSTLTIKVGDTVTWTNQDAAKHTVTSDSGSELNSELLGKGRSYSHTFATAGTYNYHCTPHPYMTGKVIVE